MTFDRRLFKVFIIALALISGACVIASSGGGSSVASGGSSSAQDNLVTSSNSAPTLQDLVWAFIPLTGTLKAVHDNPKLAQLGRTGLYNALSHDPKLGMSADEYKKAMNELGWGEASDVIDFAGLIAKDPNLKGELMAFGGILSVGGHYINNEIPQEKSFASGSTSSSTRGSFSSSGPRSEKNDLGGINFTSIKPNYISVNEDSSGGVNFDLVLKAQKADEASPEIDAINSTLISAIAFMTGLAVNDNKFWVNLNPYDPDKIIDEQLRQSEVGRIMLEADFQMKRDINHYRNPCANETGKIFWNLLDKKHDALTQRCMVKFPGEIKEIGNVWFGPVTRFWIVPDKVYAYANGTQIYIINATLTINSEPVEKYSIFHVNNQDTITLSKGCLEELNKSAKEYSQYARELTDHMILPYVIASVNYGEKYEDIRDIYIALTLAQWYKSRIIPPMEIFQDRLESSRSAILKAPRPWSPNEIWDRYVYSSKNGEYKCWKNTTTKTATGSITQSSLRASGGVDFANLRDHLAEIERMPLTVQDQIKRAITYGFIDEGKEILFGNRLHVNSRTNSHSYSNIAGSHDEKAFGQSTGLSPTAKDTGNASRSSCPDGWRGPNEKGECMRFQVTSKS